MNNYKKVSYSKQIARQISCCKTCGSRRWP